MLNWFKRKKPPSKAKGDIIVQDVTGQSTVIVQTGDTHIHKHEKADEIVPPDLYHLPKPTTALIGRKTELTQLTETFKNPNKRLAVIVAAGGIGKSALTDEWLQQIAKENYCGKNRVFGWSFYSQGSHNTFTNSQPFFSAVLPYLGVTEIPKDEIEKARVLAKCLQQNPCLLVLDGIEPLQYSPNLKTMNGELQDSSLKEFIACFRRTAGQSFVLMSSRQPLVELKKWQAEHYLSLDLQTLPHEDGAALLQALGVKGNEEERKTISKDLNGHALSLVLMGHLLVEYHQGDCRYAKELPPLTSAHGDSDAEKDSRHALRVLDYYDSLQDDASRCFLQLLGLFDRPMNAAEKAELIQNSQYAEPLWALSDKQWQAIEHRLEKCGLLLGKKGSFARLEWDTHPIIRGYFGYKFKKNHCGDFKQAHRVLFDYYKNLPEKEFPDTLEEMQPLYMAVEHGCLASEYRIAFSEIYYKRILRCGEYYNQKLGAHSQELTVLSFFCMAGSDFIENTLTEDDQVELFANISFNLMSLGRLQDAIKPRETDLILSKKLKNWKSAASAAQNLVDLYLPLGQLNQAKNAAQQAIDYAQLSEDVLRQIGCQFFLASVLHRSGHLSEAYSIFQRAEVLEQKITDRHLLIARGNRFHALLLDTINNSADLQKIIIKTEKSLENDLKNRHLLGIAIGYFTLARTRFAFNKLAQAENAFEQAIQYIEKANTIHRAPPFFLYRADFYLAKNQLNSAQADLNSAWEIIERCGMKLYAVDYLLIHGRYSLATADIETALNHYEEAKQLIEETGYHLRDAELDLLAALCCQRHGNIAGKNADFYLQKAKKRIEEIGQWGLMPRWEKVAKGEIA